MWNKHLQHINTPQSPFVSQNVKCPPQGSNLFKKKRSLKMIKSIKKHVIAALSIFSLQDLITERIESSLPISTLAPCQACSSRGKQRKRGCRERVWMCGGCVRGQTFPWQDPRDPAEGRVQPLKERLRARQSISGLHLHNKWSSHGFSSPLYHTDTHTHKHT